MQGKMEEKGHAAKEKMSEAGHDMEKRFREMKQKVTDYVARAKMDHTLKKLLKQDPVGVLLAADLGFASAEEVREYIYWVLFGP